MKTQDEILNKMMNINSDRTKYPAMTYEQGAEAALQWVLEEITDEDLGV